MTPFAAKYGPWAVVIGASEGLGAAFAEAIAARGVHVVLVARREDRLAEVAERVRAAHGVEARPLALDAGDRALADRLAAATGDLEVGLLVFNAAYAPVGAFVDTALDDLVRIVEVNAAGPVRAVRALAPAMVSRGHGGIVLMSSLAGQQGSPRIATYAATKAFGAVLAEALWRELGPGGVDVVGVVAGAIRTPAYGRASKGEAPGTLDASEVARQALDGLGRGPRVVPGVVNQLAAFLMGRLLPRRVAVAVMDANTRELT